MTFKIGKQRKINETKAGSAKKNKSINKLKNVQQNRKTQKSLPEQTWISDIRYRFRRYEKDKYNK